MTGPLPDYPFYSALWHGFWNPRFYAGVASRWQGRGFAWLFLVVALSVIPLAVVMWVVLDRFYTAELPHMLRQMPEILFSEGKASVDGEQPQVIRLSSGAALIMVDTQGTYRDPESAGVPVLVTQEALIVRQSGTATRYYGFDDIKETMLLTPKTVEQLAMTVKPWLVPVAAFGLWLAFSIGRLVQALFYALLGLAVAAVLRVRMSYAALLQVSIVAVGNVVLVSALGTLLMGGVPVPITVLLALFYLWFGIRATRDWARAQGDAS